MMKSNLLALAAAACAFLLAIPLTAAQQSKPKAPAAKPAASQRMWPPETVSGRVEMVDAASNLVVVEGPGGVPFDMLVTSKTRIESGNRRVRLEDLAHGANQTVSVQFIPERRGDVARSIRLIG